MTFEEVFIAFVEEQGWVYTESREYGPLGAHIPRIILQSNAICKDAKVIFVCEKFNNKYNHIDTAVMVCDDGTIISENGIFPYFTDHLSDPDSLERIKAHIESRNKFGRFWCSPSPPND